MATEETFLKVFLSAHLFLDYFGVPGGGVSLFF